MLAAIIIRLYFCSVKTKNKETMRTANNNSNFTVEALVAKYRNFVEDHASYDIIGADADFIGSMEYTTYSSSRTYYRRC